MLRRAAFTGLLYFCAAALQAAAAQVALAGPALLLDVSNGKVLYAENPDHQWHPASLTKIMTAYLTFEALKTGKLKLNDRITCSARAHKVQPSKIGLPVGAKMSVRLALNALIIKSANDVAIMLAEAIGGSHDRFVAKMNATAARLGMTRTHFVNPNGLPAKGQVTTARDLAKLSRALLRDYPQYNGIWSRSGFKIGKRFLRSHNSLLKTFTGADGLKTGFICDSGYNVVATATRDGRKLMAVVLGATTGRSRSIRAASLLEHGFNTYGWKLFFNATSIDNMPIDAKARRVRSIRSSVKSWVCGYRPAKPRLSAKVRKQRARKRAANIRRAKQRKARKARAVRRSSRARKAKVRNKARNKG